MQLDSRFKRDRTANLRGKESTKINVNVVEPLSVFLSLLGEKVALRLKRFTVDTRPLTPSDEFTRRLKRKCFTGGWQHLN